MHGTIAVWGGFPSRGAGGGVCRREGRCLGKQDIPSAHLIPPQPRLSPRGSPGGCRQNPGDQDKPPAAKGRRLPGTHGELTADLTEGCCDRWGIGNQEPSGLRGAVGSPPGLSPARLQLEVLPASVFAEHPELLRCRGYRSVKHHYIYIYKKKYSSRQSQTDRRPPGEARNTHLV